MHQILTVDYYRVPKFRSTLRECTNAHAQWVWLVVQLARTLHLG